jgi:hypothetical protein
MVDVSLPDFGALIDAVDDHLVGLGALPKYTRVERAYHGPEYLKKRFECAGVVNQCAIRMSVALQRCGFSLDGFKDKTRIHGTKLRKCTFPEPHIVGADELMKYLKKRFGLSATFSKHQISKAYATLSGRHGIVYFDNLDGKKGDHIDLFNGEAIYNEIRNYQDYGHQGGDPPTDVANRGKYTRNHYFKRASRIDFIELP